MKARIIGMVGALCWSLGCSATPTPTPAKKEPQEVVAASSPATETLETEVTEKTEAGCDQESISRVVRTRRERVTECYRKAAQKDPSLHGRIAVSLGIVQGGRLAHRGIESSDFSVELNTCVVRALEGLAFSAAIQQPCVVVYPFVFSASVRKTP